MSACSDLHVERRVDLSRFVEPFPLELQDRVSPAQWAAFITQLNVHLARAYSIRGAVLDNLLAIASWWTSLAWKTSTFEKVSPAPYLH